MQELYNNAPEEIETREIKSTSEMRSETSTRTNVRVYNEQDNPELICEMNMTKGDNRVATFSIFLYKAYDIKLHTFVFSCISSLLNYKFYNCYNCYNYYIFLSYGKSAQRSTSRIYSEGASPYGQTVYPREKAESDKSSG